MNVEDCTYSVNNDSGTYRPLPALETPEATEEQQEAAAQAVTIRVALAQFFAKELEVAPTKVNSERVDVNGYDTEIRGCTVSAS